MNMVSHKPPAGGIDMAVQKAPDSAFECIKQLRGRLQTLVESLSLTSQRIRDDGSGPGRGDEGKVTRESDMMTVLQECFNLIHEIICLSHDIDGKLG